MGSRSILTLALALATAPALAPLALQAQAATATRTPAPPPPSPADSGARRAPPATDLARTRLPLDPDVLAGTLPNGMRYYVRANHKPEKRAELRLVVNAGSVLEDPDQLGLAHVVEHMAFNGTRHFQKHQLVDYLESIGMRFGADLNASTDFDETTYMLQVPTDSAHALATGLEILDDWAQGQLFDTTMVHKERGVVLEEWRLGRGAEQRIRNQQLPVLFGGSRYAQRLPIGTASSIEHFDPRALVRFYHDWYRPDLMAVVAVGDFDAHAIEQAIRARFGAIPRPPRARARASFDVPARDTTRYAIATDREADQTRISVYWRAPLDSVRTEADYRRMLVERLHDRMLSTRLGELAQKPNPPFVGAGVGRGRIVRTDEVVYMGATVRDGGAATGLDALVTEAERARRFGFTPGELGRAKANLLRSLERAFAERDKTESDAYADEYVDNFLNGDPAPGIALEYRLAQTLLPGITLAEVNAVSSGGDGRDRVVLVSAPAKPDAPVPERAQLGGVFTAVGTKTIEPYRDDVSDAPLVPTLPTPAAIAAERAIADLGARELRLGNGVRVILKPTDFKADEVLLGAWSPGGTSLLDDRDAALAGLGVAAVRAGGLGSYSQIELGKALAGKAASVYPALSSTRQELRGSASPKDLETLFQLVYLTLTAPRADTAAVAALRQRLHAVLANRGADPESVYGDSLSAVLASHSPRARPLTPALLDSLDLDRALRTYRERFGDAGDLTFVLVGSFDVDSIRPLLVKYLGALPALGRHEHFRDVDPLPPEGVVRKVVRKGVDPKSRVDLFFSGPFEPTLENRVALQTLAQVLDIHLRDVLREQLGGTYDIGASASSAREPRARYSLQVSFGCAPERVDSLTARVFREIERLRAQGPDTADLAKVKEQTRRQREVALKQNGWWLDRLSYAAAYDPDFGSVLAGGTAQERVSIADVRAAARRYLDPAHYVEGMLLPER
jgi:zinc protease